MDTPVYLDNNATTRTDPRVLEAMLPCFTELFGNPSSMHRFGEAVGAAIRTARGQVQALVGAAHDHEILFLSGATEANSTAIHSALRAQPERRAVVTSAVEHHAVLGVLEHLEKTDGIEVRIMPVDRHGRLDLEAYRRALRPDVALVSLMWANNETGVVNPVPELAELAKEVGATFHTDAVQAVGKLPVSVAGTGIDMLSLSAHKLHGPKGIGALYVRKGTRFRPLLRGGGQERGRRAGTENVPGIVGLGMAAELAARSVAEDADRIRTLRDRLEHGILGAVGHCFAVGGEAERVPNTSTIAFEFIEGEAILLLLDKAGIAASSGSACTSGSLEPSHVLRAMDVPFTAAHGAIRFSLSRETTEAEVDRVIAAVPPIVARLRAFSPFWDAGRATGQAGNFAPVYS
ncbi:cysteine desulfurase NifS [Rhodospirillum centenum]|uniref:Cysteine desulfurase n=1 Tax=Rhodospirillum centenum (strain ATCC 51521 / SW) TaxID=414684 RepID=B6IR29_RHOCS|nr:cysteine desulfurase NifS [Rhodospirillum centenum]ACI97915.1 cysteine desulfurase [Rhodospirillum centenum SW]